jgi:hypothetical protein
MGLVSGLMGHATEIDIEKIKEEFSPLLIKGEALMTAFKLVRDLFVFTNFRLILVDKQGVTGKKVDYQTIPYKSITRFAKESAGVLDLDAELKIWIHGEKEPIKKEFRKNDSVNKIYRILSTVVLGRK